MDRVLRHSWFRSAGTVQIALLALIVLLGVGGYLLTSTTIRNDRDDSAARRAQFESVQTQEVLGRARAYVAGLGNVLAGEPEAAQSRFARLAGGTAASVGLNDVLWVESVPDSGRMRYERRLGSPISRLTPSGRFERAPRAASYLPATFTSGSRPELRRGVDVSTLPGLGAAIRDRATVFSVSASRPGTLGGEPGFYLLQAASFGRGADSRGFLVTFVPRGWFSTTLEGDPRRVAISQDGRRIEGDIGSAHAVARFESLGRRWRIDVAREPPSGLQSTLPWLALAWPIAAALIAFGVGRAIISRRRAERDVERIWDLSADLLAIIGFDGYYRRVNPSFKRTLGYSTEEIQARPWSDLIHPDDLPSAQKEFADVRNGKPVIGFEARLICADGSERMLEWNARAVPAEGVIYGIARDLTESRRAEREFEEVFNLSPDLIGICGLDGYLQRVNPAFEEAFGYSSEELLSRPLLDLGHPEDRGLAREAFARLARGEEVPRFENRNIRADGSILWLEWSSRPLSAEGLIYGAARDITDRKLSEEQLRQAQDAVEASRDELRVLAEEQAALRRVATLVARGVSPTEVLDAVAGEVSGLLATDITTLVRYEPDGAATVIAIRGDIVPPDQVGTRITLEGESAMAAVRRTGRPARIEVSEDAFGSAAARAREMGVRSGVGAPITVEGRIWGGVFAAWTQHEPPQADAESRMAQFTALVATAIANAESRAELAVHAEDQAALRRVATLVARGVSPTEVFDAVAMEVGLLFGADAASMLRYGSDGTAVIVAGRGSHGREIPVGARLTLEGGSATASVWRTRRTTWTETFEGPPDSVGAFAHGLGMRAGLGAPIVVEGRLWGVMVAAWAQEPASRDIEARITQFTELAATAIANAESRAELAASRARVVAAAAEERQRVVRDLHDGAQQRLVHAVITLKLALRGLASGDRHAKEFVTEALDHAEQANSELRELVHGILPGVLTSGGLRAGVEELVSRTSLPVTVDVPAERFPSAIEATAYFVVSEALTNVVKHSDAHGAEVAAHLDNGALRVEVCDDGIGGADPDKGSGLTGLRDRVEALGGSIEINSPSGGGTSLFVKIPIEGG